jgi:preprotein translocase subunit SecG
MVKSPVMLYYLVATLYVLACLLLLLVVLLQQGKGGDIASAFGGGGSQTAFGARAGATVLTRATAILGAIFMVGAVVLSIVGRPGGSSLMRGVGGPPPAPVTAPQAQPPLEPTKPAPAPQQQPTTLPQPEQAKPEQAKPETQKPGPPK